MGYGLKRGMWNGATTLYWQLSQGTVHSRLEEAFAIWGAGIGIRFESLLTANTNAHFRVAEADSTGWSPAIKKLSLKSGEPLGVVLHEVGHLLGLSHEQDRPDARDNYYSNMQAWHLQGAIDRGAKLQEYGAYDPGSIMLYPDTNYKPMTRPSAGDFAAARAVNGLG